MDHEEMEVTAQVLKVLAHPLRLGVIHLLADGEKTCTQLYQDLGCSQSMMSQQLKILSQQGLISIRKEGTSKFYKLLNPDVLKLFDCMRGHLRKFLNFNNGSEFLKKEEW